MEKITSAKQYDKWAQDLVSQGQAMWYQAGLKEQILRANLSSMHESSPQPNQNHMIYSKEALEKALKEATQQKRMLADVLGIPQTDFDAHIIHNPEVRKNLIDAIAANEEISFGEREHVSSYGEVPIVKEVWDVMRHDPIHTYHPIAYDVVSHPRMHIEPRSYIPLTTLTPKKNYDEILFDEKLNKILGEVKNAETSA